MTDAIAGAAALAGALLLFTIGAAIYRNAFGIVTKNAQLTARIYGRLRDPREVREAVEANSRTAAVGFMVVDGVAAVGDVLWIINRLM
jgi:hypothetical protein